VTRRAIVGSGRLLTMTGSRPAATGLIEGPWVVVIEGGRIGQVRPGVLRPGDADDVHDVGRALCTPGLVDPHTHLIYAGDRADEVAARSRGARYDGGGILRTVAATSAASDEQLRSTTRARLSAAAAAGTTTIEVKSGYGLTAASERRLLRLIREAAEGLPMRVLRTFLGAHAVPPGSSPAAQAEAVIEMLPTLAAEADHVDVFCEPHLFDLGLTRRIAAAAARAGLPLKLHADQLTHSGAALLGAELGAISVDHLEQLDEGGARELAASSTVATILPGPALMLRAGSPPVRALLDAGAHVAIGSDANAGTFGQPSMVLAMGLAVALGFTVEEAVRSATAGAARALGRPADMGVLATGAAADLVAWDAEHEGDFAFRVGGVRPRRVWFEGERRSIGGD
jgi:imidazolonepropionase